MGLVNMKCPNCGAELKIDKDRENVYCEYCGSHVYSLIKTKIVEEHVTRDETQIKKMEIEKQEREKMEKYTAPFLTGDLGAMLILFGILGEYSNWSLFTKIICMILGVGLLILALILYLKKK